MANPIPFAEANAILARPKNMTENECASIECYRNGDVVISKWQLSDEDLEEIKKNGGKIYLILKGETMQPAIIRARKPFE